MWEVVRWIVVGLFVTVFGAACGHTDVSGSPNAASSGPPSVDQEDLVQPDWIAHSFGASYYFDSTEEMAATADVVVLGTVTEVGVGRALDMPEDVSDSGEATYSRDATIDVEQVLKGPADLESVVLEQEGWAEGVSFALDDQPWAQVNDRGVYFLYDSTATPPGHYFLISAVGQIVLTESSVLNFAETPLAAEYLTSDPEQLLVEVRAATTEALDLGIPPQEPMSEAQVEIDLPDQPRDEGVAAQGADE